MLGINQLKQLPNVIIGEWLPGAKALAKIRNDTKVGRGLGHTLPPGNRGSVGRRMLFEKMKNMMIF
jgi:hypothetical protein